MNINELIEKEANEYAFDGHNKSRLYADTEIEMFKRDGYVDGANFALSQFRWRKVEEELPKIGDNIILVTNHPKDPKSRDAFPIWNENYIIVLKRDWKYWMPIPE